MTELKPCPFCGGEAEMWVSDVTDRAVIYCKVCDARIMKPNEQEAIEAWNMRVPPTSEEIEEYIEKTHKGNMEMVSKLKKHFE
jgi:Lar family restriction alleviation protein